MLLYFRKNINLLIIVMFTDENHYDEENKCCFARLCHLIVSTRRVGKDFSDYPKYRMMAIDRNNTYVESRYLNDKIDR